MLTTQNCIYTVYFAVAFFNFRLPKFTVSIVKLYQHLLFELSNSVVGTTGILSSDM